jgi:hypothetical protein
MRLTRFLHELELAQQVGPLEEEEMAERARASDRFGLQGAALCVVSASGPRQPILRPAQLEEPTLERDLHREVLLGQNAVFDTTTTASWSSRSHGWLLNMSGSSWDVLVHGEPERNDMVQYFGEQLTGSLSPSTWEQSHGSRCAKPPILYGDVSSPAP